MKSFVCAAAALALAGTAAAGPFSIGAVDASDGTVDGGRPGTGIDVTGTIYQDAGGGMEPTSEPSQFIIGLAPTAEFDSYLTIDSGPVEPAPGNDGSNVAAASQAPGSPGFGASSYRGSWFVSGPFVAAFEVTDSKPANANWEMFVGRITHTGTISGRLAVAIAEDNAPGFTAIEGDIVTEAQVAAGEGIILQDVNGAPLIKSFQDPQRGYAWVVKQSEVEINSTLYTVSDIYLQNVEIPTPGALALLGVAGVGAARRRR